MNADSDGRDDIENLLSRRAPDLSWVQDVPALTFEEVKARAEGFTADERAAVEDDMRRVELGHGALEVARGHIAMGDLSTAEHYLTMATNYGASGVNCLLDQIDELRAELPSYERNVDGGTNADLYDSSFQWARNIVDDAKKEAAQIVDDALSTMKRVIGQAHERADEIVAAAKAEAAVGELRDVSDEVARTLTWLASIAESKHDDDHAGQKVFLLPHGAGYSTEEMGATSENEQHVVARLNAKNDAVMRSWLLSWRMLANTLDSTRDSSSDVHEVNILRGATPSKARIMDFHNGLWRTRGRILSPLIQRAGGSFLTGTTFIGVRASRKTATTPPIRKESEPISEDAQNRLGEHDIDLVIQVVPVDSVCVYENTRDDCKK